MYFVSRQSYWPDGDLVVEIACGGTDYANPDMLVEKWANLGEGKDYDDPREALKAARAIRDAWNEVIEGKKARVEVGWTMGFTIPFQNEPTEGQLDEWANREYYNLPRCGGCGEIMPSDRGEWCWHPLSTDQFCSQSCCMNDYHHNLEDEDDEDLNDPLQSAWDDLEDDFLWEEDDGGD